MSVVDASNSLPCQFRLILLPLLHEYPTLLLLLLHLLLLPLLPPLLLIL